MVKWEYGCGLKKKEVLEFKLLQPNELIKNLTFPIQIEMLIMYKEEKWKIMLFIIPIIFERPMAQSTFK